MADGPADLPVAEPAAASPDLIDRARALVGRYPECFWFWAPGARVQTLEDVRLVVRHLRTYGDRAAWADAQELHRCLSHRSSGPS